MSFSYDINLSTPKDKVRFYIQDNIEKDVFFEDEEIQAMLTEYPNPKACAIQLCYNLAALFASVPDREDVGPYSVTYKSLSEKYTKLAESLRAQQSRLISGYAGGLYKQETKETLKDNDLTKYAFHRYMMRNRRG